MRSEFHTNIINGRIYMPELDHSHILSPFCFSILHYSMRQFILYKLEVWKHGMILNFSSSARCNKWGTLQHRHESQFLTNGKSTSNVGISYLQRKQHILATETWHAIEHHKGEFNSKANEPRCLNDAFGTNKLKPQVKKIFNHEIKHSVDTGL